MRWQFQRRIRARAEAPEHPNTIQKESPKSTNYKPRSILLTHASPTSTTVYKWKRRLQRLTQLLQKHDRTQRQSRHCHLERIHRPLLELGQPIPERMHLNAVKAIHHQEIHRRQRGRNCGEWKKGNLATRGAHATKRASTGARGSRKGGKKNRKAITVDDFGSEQGTDLLKGGRVQAMQNNYQHNNFQPTCLAPLLWTSRNLALKCAYGNRQGSKAGMKIGDLGNCFAVPPMGRKQSAWGDNKGKMRDYCSFCATVHRGEY